MNEDIHCEPVFTDIALKHLLLPESASRVVGRCERCLCDLRVPCPYISTLLVDSRTAKAPRRDGRCICSQAYERRTLKTCRSDSRDNTESQRAEKVNAFLSVFILHHDIIYICPTVVCMVFGGDQLPLADVQIHLVDMRASATCTYSLLYYSVEAEMTEL